MKNSRQFVLICGILALASFVRFHAAAVPKNTQALELSAGWNLIALEGVPLRMQEFLELRPMVYDEERHSYIMATEKTTFQRGMAAWIYSPEARTIKIPLVSASTTLPPVQPTDFGWTLAGAVDNTPPWLEQVTRPFFQWNMGKGFVPAETPEAKSGYWVKLK